MPTVSVSPSGRHAYFAWRHFCVWETHWRHLAAVLNTTLQSDEGDVVVGPICSLVKWVRERVFHFKHHLGVFGLGAVVLSNDNTQFRCHVGDTGIKQY